MIFHIPLILLFIIIPIIYYRLCSGIFIYNLSISSKKVNSYLLGNLYKLYKLVNTRILVYLHKTLKL